MATERLLMRNIREILQLKWTNGPKLALTVARPGPDPVWMHTELRRPGVTLELLHLEYLAAHADGYRYSAFCAHYRRWFATGSSAP